MNGAWEKQPTPVGMGMKPQRSKTFTVSSFDGWERSSPARAFLLLRAWMLWPFAYGGFAEAERGRHRQYLEDCAALVREIREQNCADRLLGQAKANALLKEFVPALTATLLKDVRRAA